MNLFYTWGAILGPFVAGAIDRTQSYGWSSSDHDRAPDLYRDDGAPDQAMGETRDNRSDADPLKANR